MRSPDHRFFAVIAVSHYDMAVHSDILYLTSDKNYKVKDAIIVHSMDALLEELKNYNSEEIYVIGGESIYRQMVDMCDVAHITKIDYAYEADSYFPNLDEKEDWEITADSEEQTYFDLEFYFLKYEKKKK